jgi:hypothetical protein
MSGLLLGGADLTPVTMRDTDCDLRSLVVVRAAGVRPGPAAGRAPRPGRRASGPARPTWWTPRA